MRYAVGRWSADRWDRRTRRMFAVAGRSTATGVAANECVCNFWNPSSTQSVWVAEVFHGLTANAGTLDPTRFCRTTTAGTTPSSTVTPDVDNDFERETAPVSGVLLHLGDFLTEPVLATPELFRLNFPITGVVHTMQWVFPAGIRVGPGTGLAFATTGSVGRQAVDIAFRFWE